MYHPCRLALVGLPPVERTLLEGLFLQDLQRGNGYALVGDLDHADLIITNADDVHGVRHLQTRGLPAVVLLIGESDAGTGWPVLSRPIRLRAVMEAVGHLKLPQREMDAQAVDSGSAELDPAFETTKPFAPLEMAGSAAPSRSGGDGLSEPSKFESTQPNFEATQPFEKSEPGVLPNRRPPAAPPGFDDLIDARSVLMWRGAQGSPANPALNAPGVSHSPSTPPLPVKAPDPGRDPHALERAALPGDWQAVARRQAKEEASRQQPLKPDTYGMSSSFPDPADHPTSPQSLTGSGPEEWILLVGGPQLAGSSLIRALRGFGFRVDHVPDGDVALTSLTSQSYRFVFLDARSLGGGTLAVCRALRKRGRALGQRPRQVVIARESTLLQPFFARLAGCDAWMVLPLDYTHFEQYLRGK